MNTRFPATCGVGKLGMLALGAVSVVAWPSNLRADAEPVKPYLGASARSAIVYRLPLGAGGRRLLARGWMAQPDSRNGVKFVVRIDGKKVYQSRTVNITDPWVDIRVRIPVGARVLELAVDDLGDNGGDRSYWVRPRIE